MKRQIIMLILALVPLASAAQPAARNEFQGLFNRYSGREGYTTVEITGEMLKLLGGDAAAGNASVFDGIDKIRIIKADNESPALVEEVREVARTGGFTTVTSVISPPRYVIMYLRKISADVSEFILLVHGGGDNVTMSIRGRNLDAKKISGLSGIIGGDEPLYIE